MPGPDPAPHREPEGNERWIVLGAFLFGLAALVAIVLEDYEPRKLAPVFVMLAWFPLIALHELGHALAARALGWDVEEMVVGFGRPVQRLELAGVPVILKMYPLGGSVVPVPRELRGVRWKSALIYAAGPLAELALAGALLVALGPDVMLARSDAIGVIAAQAVAAAACFGAVMNLIPRDAETERGSSVTDGKGILLSLARPSATWTRQVRGGHETRIEDASLLGDAEATAAACEAAFDALGDDPHLRATMNAALARLDPDAARAAVAGRRLPDRVRARFG